MKMNMNMKKLLVFISALAMSIMLLAGVCSAAASQGSNGKDKVAILLMGSNDFKSTQYFTMIENHFLKNNPHASQIVLVPTFRANTRNTGWTRASWRNSSQPRMTCWPCRNTSALTRCWC